VDAGQTASLAGLTVANGNAGGICSNGGTLTVNDSTVSRNSATVSGGGIESFGTLTISGSTLSANTAGSVGGGIFNAASGTLTVKDCTVLNNVALLGADIFNLGTLIRDDSTVSVIGP
jgi:predicted outer membrane repeat protein